MRLTIYDAIQCNGGVSTQYRRGRQLPLRKARKSCFEFQLRYPLYVIKRWFVMKRDFQLLCVLMRIGQQQLMFDTELLQELAAARAL